MAMAAEYTVPALLSQNTRSLIMRNSRIKGPKVCWCNEGCLGISHFSSTPMPVPMEQASLKRIWPFWVLVFVITTVSGNY